MEKIQKFSLFFRVIFQILFCLVPVFTTLAWLYYRGAFVLPGGIIHMCFIPPAYENNILHALTLNERFLALAVSFVPTIIILYILSLLIRLFKLYEQGKIFTLKNVIYIRNIAYAMLLSQLIEPFYQAVMGLVLTLNNPPGRRLIAIGFDQTNLGIICSALIIILISWVMAEGCKLQEEQHLTV